MNDKTAWICLIGLLLHALPADAQTRARPPVPAKTKVAAKAKDTTVADAIVLKDGKTLLGQVVAERGSTMVIVRRAWAAKNLPEWSAKWEKAEAASTAGASAQRRERLQAWRRDRGGAHDTITSWLDRELAKPANDAGPTPLMLVKLVRPEVKSISKRGVAANRMMRLAWTISLDDAESLPIADVKSAIDGRGLIAEGDAPVSLDSLLPLTSEPDADWALRRAATELMYDQDVRFIRYGSVILPEPNPGEAPNIASAGAILSNALKDIFGEAPADPLPATLNSVSSKGHTAALVTNLNMSPDFSSVTVEATMYVFSPRGGWSRGLSRAGTFRSGDIPPAEVNAIAEDPQIKSAFGMIDSIGLFQINDSMKRQSLAVGATTQRALRVARSALSRDLANMALSLEVAPAKPKTP